MKLKNMVDGPYSSMIHTIAVAAAFNDEALCEKDKISNAARLLGGKRGIINVTNELETNAFKYEPDYDHILEIMNSEGLYENLSLLLIAAGVRIHKREVLDLTDSSLLFIPKQIKSRDINYEDIVYLVLYDKLINNLEAKNLVQQPWYAIRQDTSAKPIDQYKLMLSATLHKFRKTFIDERDCLERYQDGFLNLLKIAYATMFGIKIPKDIQDKYPKFIALGKTIDFIDADLMLSMLPEDERALLYYREGTYIDDHASYDADHSRYIKIDFEFYTETEAFSDSAIIKLTEIIDVFKKYMREEQTEANEK